MSPVSRLRPRLQQKARTRKALVDAAVGFVREGRDFSVGDVADAALVGRATAYTYFKTKESLRAQAVLTFVASTDFPSFGDIFERTPDASARVEAVVDASDKSIRLHEAQYRALLRSSLDDGAGDQLPRRPANRRQWLNDALAPLQGSLTGASFDRLAGALSLCIGIEAHVTLRDVCGFSEAEASAIKTWAAAALVAAATAPSVESLDRVAAKAVGVPKRRKR